VKFTRPESVRNELRSVERQTAIRILHALTEYGDSGVGDVKMLAGQGQGYFSPATWRLPCHLHDCQGPNHDYPCSASIRIVSLNSADALLGHSEAEHS
jgi:hypothetical protein